MNSIKVIKYIVYTFLFLLGLSCSNKIRMETGGIDYAKITRIVDSVEIIENNYVIFTRDGDLIDAIYTDSLQIKKCKNLKYGNRYKFKVHNILNYINEAETSSRQYYELLSNNTKTIYSSLIIRNHCIK